MKNLTQLILLFSITLFANDYTISKFLSGKVIPPANNTIISTAKLVATPIVQNNKILLRRKFGIEGYGLFSGSLAKGAYSKLSVFRYPIGASLIDIINYKFYASQHKAESRSTLDLKDIYFDNNFIYTINRSILIYKDGVAYKKLKALMDRPAILKIVSKPVGANVFIDDVKKGNTPYNAGVLEAPSVVVRLEKDGYYIQENFIELKSGEITVKKFKLVKTLLFDDGTVGTVEAYTAENTESIDELESRMKMLTNDIKILKLKEKKLLASLIRRYPKFPTRNEFEEIADFQIREMNFNNKKEEKIVEIREEANERVLKYDIAFKKLKNYKTSIEERIYNKYFSTSNLELSRYDIHKHAFPIKIVIKESTFDFIYIGYLSMATNKAKVFKNKISNGRLKLSYKNKKIKIKKLGKYIKLYCDLGDFVLNFKNVDYKLIGKYEFENFITSNNSWKKMIKIEAKSKLIKNMVKIPAGSFEMGSINGDEDEKPKHRVYISSFWIDRYEVTQAQFYKVMGENPSNFKDCPNCPVENLTWYEAKEYCNKLSKRLPTEAEWEYSAKAGSNTTFYWADTIDATYCWYNQNSGYETHFVASKKPNSYGLYDMSGNVWEWCEDFFEEYNEEEVTNPINRTEGNGRRVIRGGSSYRRASNLSSTFRYRNYPNYGYKDVGFRCVKNAD